MYEKDFPQTNATIATLQVSQLVFNYLIGCPVLCSNINSLV